MLYEYQCEKCGEKLEGAFRMGEAPRTVECRCGAEASRVFSTFALSINGGIDRKTTFGEEMKQRNERAGRRMRKEHGKGPVRTVAYDYGNGRVEEVK